MKKLRRIYFKSSKLIKKLKKEQHYKNLCKSKEKNYLYKRFKGLGEMNPEELWQTTLNPEIEQCLRVQYSKGTKDKSKEDQKMIKILMGD